MKDVIGNGKKGFFSVPDKLPLVAMIVVCEELDNRDIKWLEDIFRPLAMDELRKYNFAPQKFEAAAALLPESKSNDRRNDLSLTLTAAWKTLERPSLVIVQLPQRDPEVYSHVKWWGDCHQGVATVCITYQKLEKSLNEALVGNLA
jgi:hypothetical protein